MQFYKSEHSKEKKENKRTTYTPDITIMIL